MSRTFRSRPAVQAPGRDLGMTVKLRKLSAAATVAPEELVPVAPEELVPDMWLSWYDDVNEAFDGTSAFNVPLLVKPDDDRGRPVAPYGPAFVARLYYVDADGAYMGEIPSDAVVTWTYTVTPAVDIKVIAPDGARMAVIMPPHSADAGDGSGNYFGEALPDFVFGPVDFELFAHVVVAGVETVLSVTATFINSGA